MQDKTICNNRRDFLKTGAALTLAAGTNRIWSPKTSWSVEHTAATIPTELLSNAKVAIVPCKTYGKEVKTAYKKCFDLLGGIGSMVKGKTVSIKVNMTGRAGQEVRELFGRLPGETYLTNGDTATALAAILLEEGAKRVRILECINDLQPMEDMLFWTGWEVKDLLALGNVELENTRNLGQGKKYSTLPVPNGGYLFSSFELNHSYEDTDVFISLSKMKQHAVAEVTLSMKNIFGITPNTHYGDDAGTEDAVRGRSRLHGSFGGWRRRRGNRPPLPGEKEGDFPNNQGYRVPHIIADICAARPVHLSIIDGITAMSGGEGYWSGRLKFTEPGVLIAGLNPVSTDAVGMKVMGYENPRADVGEAPFMRGHNHVLLAEQCGLGTAEISKIDVRGMTIEEALYPYGEKG